MFGASCWGISGCVGQYLFTRQGMDSRWLVPIRLLLAGLVLCGYFLVKDRPLLVRPWKERRNAADLVIYGLFGVSCCQFLYFLTIQLSTAGVATILQDVSPVLILGVTCVAARRTPRVFEVFSVLLALVVGYQYLESIGTADWPALRLLTTRDGQVVLVECAFIGYMAAQCIRTKK